MRYTSTVETTYKYKLRSAPHFCRRYRARTTLLRPDLESPRDLPSDCRFHLRLFINESLVLRAARALLGSGRQLPAP